MRLCVLNYASSSCICVYSLINLCVHVNSPFWPGVFAQTWLWCCCMSVSAVHTALRITQGGGKRLQADSLHSLAQIVDNQTPAPLCAEIRTVLRKVGAVNVQTA